VNLFALHRLVRAVLPHLGPGATITTTASMEAYQPAPDRLDYAASKGAINNYSKGLSQQLVSRGIRVNVVAPGPTWTVLQVTDGVDPSSLPEFGSSESPMGRAAQPAELAPAYVFLASAESSYVAGETLNVNGGMVTP
jgi:NAD(P)-dependent dehydrogenase (short-subunit alcohol dehydrogenase family)